MHIDRSSFSSCGSCTCAFNRLTVFHPGSAGSLIWISRRRAPRSPAERARRGDSTAERADQQQHERRSGDRRRRGGPDPHTPHHTDTQVRKSRQHGQAQRRGTHHTDTTLPSRWWVHSSAVLLCLRIRRDAQRSGDVPTRSAPITAPYHPAGARPHARSLTRTPNHRPP